MSLQRNALLMMLLTGLLGILGQWDTSLARAWCLPAALLLLGLSYEAWTLGRCELQLSLSGPARWLLGRLQTVRFVFRQERCHVLIVQVALSAPEVFASQPSLATLRLARGAEAAAELAVRARRLGRYTWPTPQLRVCGLLKLAWWPRTVTADYACAVVPDVVSRARRIAGDLSRGEQRARGPGSGAEILQLRDYRHGDPWRAIDWKASARRGHLISRELAEERRLEILIAIDAGRTSTLAAGEIDRLGLYVNVAARLAQRAAELDDAVGALVFAERPLLLLPPRRGAASAARIRAALTACTAHQGDSNPALAAARIRAASPRRTLVVLLTDLQDASTEELVQAVRLLTPKHFALIGALENPAIATLPRAAAADPLDPYRVLAATEYHNALAANVRALRALGAAALTARPEHLDAAVCNAYREFRRHRRI